MSTLHRFALLQFPCTNFTGFFIILNSATVTRKGNNITHKVRQICSQLEHLSFTTRMRTHNKMLIPIIKQTHHHTPFNDFIDDTRWRYGEQQPPGGEGGGVDGANIGGVGRGVAVTLQEWGLEDILETLHRVDGVLGVIHTSSIYIVYYIRGRIISVGYTQVGGDPAAAMFRNLINQHDLSYICIYFITYTRTYKTECLPVGGNNNQGPVQGATEERCNDLSQVIHRFRQVVWKNTTSFFITTLRTYVIAPYPTYSKFSFTLGGFEPWDTMRTIYHAVYIYLYNVGIRWGFAND